MYFYNATNVEQNIVRSIGRIQRHLFPVLVVPLAEVPDAAPAAAELAEAAGRVRVRVRAFNGAEQVVVPLESLDPVALGVLENHELFRGGDLHAVLVLSGLNVRILMDAMFYQRVDRIACWSADHTVRL